MWSWEITKIRSISKHPAVMPDHATSWTTCHEPEPASRRRIKMDNRRLVIATPTPGPFSGYGGSALFSRSKARRLLRCLALWPHPCTYTVSARQAVLLPLSGVYLPGWVHGDDVTERLSQEANKPLCLNPGALQPWPVKRVGGGLLMWVTITNVLQWLLQFQV